MCTGSSNYDSYQNHMENMLHNAFQATQMNMSGSPDANPKVFCTIFEFAEQPLYEGCNVTKLETSVRLLNIKSSHNMSQHCFNEMVGLTNDASPTKSRIPSNYHYLLGKSKRVSNGYLGN